MTQARQDVARVVMPITDPAVARLLVTRQHPDGPEIASRSGSAAGCSAKEIGWFCGSRSADAGRSTWVRHGFRERVAEAWLSARGRVLAGGGPMRDRLLVSAQGRTADG